MKKFLKITGIIVLVLVVIGASGVIFLKSNYPAVSEAPKDLKVELTPERIARGKYIANSVAVCVDCHSTRDWTKFSGPLVPGTEGKGGEAFPENFGFPGTFYAKNITPYKLKDWTDGEIFRAITAGVNKQGESLFPVMPHPNYGQLDKEDIYSIIAYVRSLPEIKNDVPERKVNFPMNLILPTIPTDGKFSSKPASTDQVNYGKYLITMAACAECHTKQDKEKKLRVWITPVASILTWDPLSCALQTSLPIKKPESVTGQRNCSSGDSVSTATAPTNRTLWQPASSRL